MKKILSSLLAVLVIAGSSLVAGAQVAEHSPTTRESAAFQVVHAAPVMTAPIELLEPARVLPPNAVELTVRPAMCGQDSCVQHYRTHNARTNAGANAIANNIGGTAVAVANEVALSTDSTAVAAADTTCPSEITTLGLARKVATFGSYTAPASLGAAFSYTLTASWSPTGTATITKVCMLNASSGGTLFFESVLGTSVTTNSGDTDTLTWTVNG